MADFLNQFYAVSQTSLYVAISRDETEDAPVFMKLAKTEGAISKAHVGIRHVGWDKPFFQIRGTTVQMCCGWHDEHHERYGMMPVVGLFLDEAEARECLLVEDAQELDPRWRKQTLEVLHTIGDEHPNFYIWWDEFPESYLNPVE